MFCTLFLRFKNLRRKIFTIKTREKSQKSPEKYQKTQKSPAKRRDSIEIPLECMGIPVIIGSDIHMNNP
jgi:hypothetical protein